MRPIIFQDILNAYHKERFKLGYFNNIPEKIFHVENSFLNYENSRELNFGQMKIGTCNR